MEENDGTVPAFATETIGGVAVNASTGKELVEDVPETKVAEPEEDEAVEEDLDGAVPAGAAAGGSGGAVQRPTTKAERRAARAKRKHGR
jgi:hypothetical protein